MQLSWSARKTVVSKVFLARTFLEEFYMVQLEDPPLKIAELLNMILYLRYVS